MASNASRWPPCGVTVSPARRGLHGPVQTLKPTFGYKLSQIGVLLGTIYSIVQCLEDAQPGRFAHSVSHGPALLKQTHEISGIRRIGTNDAKYAALRRDSIRRRASLRPIAGKHRPCHPPYANSHEPSYRIIARCRLLAKLDPVTPPPYDPRRTPRKEPP
jgi:hypothetical protein